MLLLAGVSFLQDVKLAVADLAKKWQMLGITLGIRAADLDFIQSAKPPSFDRYLRDMLSLWLRQQYDVRTKVVHVPCFHAESVEYGSSFDELPLPLFFFRNMVNFWETNLCS